MSRRPLASGGGRPNFASRKKWGLRARLPTLRRFIEALNSLLGDLSSRGLLRQNDWAGALASTLLPGAIMAFMKHCPACGESYDDQRNYCENDGTQLVVVSQPQELNSLGGTPPKPLSPTNRGQQTLITLLIGLALGVISCVALLAIYRTLPQEREPAAAPPQQPKDISVAPTMTPQPVPTEPATTPTSTPMTEATPAASPSPTPATDTQRQDDGLSALSDSPAATSGAGGHAAQPVLLRLTDGTTILADEAWRAPQGVWYRRGGVISLLARARIHSVERSAAPSPSPSAP